MSDSTNTPVGFAPPQPLLPKIMQGIGTYSGLINSVYGWASASAWNATSATLRGLTSVIGEDGLLKGTRYWLSAVFEKMPWLGKTLGAIGIVLSTYGAFTGVQAMFKKGPSIGGTLNVAGSALGIATGVNMLMGMGGWATLTNPAGWFVAGAVISASVTYGAVQSMFDSGVTAGNVALATAGFIGTWVAAELALDLLLPALMVAMPVLGLAIAVGVALFAIFWGIFHQKSSEEKAVEKLNQALMPTVWSAGPILFVAAGTTALLMSWSSAKPPTMGTMSRPMSFVLGSVNKTSAIPYIPLPKPGESPTILIEQGSGNIPTKVVIVSPSKGSSDNPWLSMKAYTLSNTIQFVSTSMPQEGYIPFFIYSGGEAIPNPAVVEALSIENSLLRTALDGNLDGPSALSATRLVGSLDHPSVSPTAI